MRAFVHLRQMLKPNTHLAEKIDALEKKYDARFKMVFQAIRDLMTLLASAKRRIGFIGRSQ